MAQANGVLKAPDFFTMESNLESGCSSEASSTPLIHDAVLTNADINQLNAKLETMGTLDILRFCKAFFPKLYQITAFGVTGLVTLDMLSKLQAESPDSPRVDVLFLDTLYHFEETLDLVERAKQRYSNAKIHVYRPKDCGTAADFEAKHGARLYETSPDLYDWLAKVEPMERGCAELGISAVLTGRRRSQGAARHSMGVIEMDADRGIVKVNPLFNWKFQKVQEYIKANDVPYNALLNRGYKSIGDWHSTTPVSEGENERAGRWKGQAKTECGIHNKKSRYAQFLAEVQAEEQEARLPAELQNIKERLRAGEVDVQA